MNVTATPSAADAVKTLEASYAQAVKVLTAITRALADAGLAEAPVPYADARKTLLAPKAKTPKAKAPAAPKAPKAIGPGAAAGRGRGRPPRFDEAQAYDLAREHASGKSINQLAQETNATRQAVKHAIERATAAATSNGVTA